MSRGQLSERMARRQVGKLDPPAGEERVGGDEEGVGLVAHKRCEGRIDLAAGAGVKDLDLQPHGASSRFHVSHRRLSRATGRVDEHGHTRGCGHQLAQESRAALLPAHR